MRRKRLAGIFLGGCPHGHDQSVLRQGGVFNILSVSHWTFTETYAWSTLPCFPLIALPCQPWWPAPPKYRLKDTQTLLRGYMQHTMPGPFKMFRIKEANDGFLKVSRVEIFYNHACSPAAAVSASLRAYESAALLSILSSNSILMPASLR